MFQKYRGKIWFLWQINEKEESDSKKKVEVPWVPDTFHRAVIDIRNPTQGERDKIKKRKTSVSIDLEIRNPKFRSIKEGMFALLFVQLFGSCPGQTSFSTDHGSITFGLPGE